MKGLAKIVRGVLGPTERSECPALSRFETRRMQLPGATSRGSHCAARGSVAHILAGALLAVATVLAAEDGAIADSGSDTAVCYAFS